jgi:HSP20 family protein
VEKVMTTSLSKLMQSLLKSSGRSFQPAWQPAVDIYHCDKEWLIKIDLAGVKKEDIEVIANNHILKLRGRRRDLQVQEGHQTYSMEISYNRFERVLELPFDVKDASIQMDFQDGMLFIRIQTKEQS